MALPAGMPPRSTNSSKRSDAVQQLDYESALSYRTTQQCLLTPADTTRRAPRVAGVAHTRRMRAPRPPSTTSYTHSVAFAGCSRRGCLLTVDPLPTMIEGNVALRSRRGMSEPEDPRDPERVADRRRQEWKPHQNVRDGDHRAGTEGDERRSTAVVATHDARALPQPDDRNDNRDATDRSGPCELWVDLRAGRRPDE